MYSFLRDFTIYIFQLKSYSHFRFNKFLINLELNSKINTKIATAQKYSSRKKAELVSSKVNLFFSITSLSSSLSTSIITSLNPGSISRSLFQTFSAKLLREFVLESIQYKNNPVSNTLDELNLQINFDKYNFGFNGLQNTNSHLFCYFLMLEFFPKTDQTFHSL